MYCVDYVCIWLSSFCRSYCRACKDWNQKYRFHSCHGYPDDNSSDFFLAYGPDNRGLSGLATGGSWLCYFKALQIGDVNKVVPIDKSSTILTMLLAFLILGEKLSILKVICMFLIGIGTCLMITKKQSDNEAKGWGWLWYAVLSAVFASLTSILGKIGISEIDSNLGTAIRTIVVLIMAWLMVFVTGKQSEIKTISKRNMLFICLSGLTTGLS